MILGKALSVWSDVTCWLVFQIVLWKFCQQDVKFECSSTTTKKLAGTFGPISLAYLGKIYICNGFSSPIAMNYQKFHLATLDVVSLTSLLCEVQNVQT